jgi:ABC-type uncharacterized transport system substrate-binding protein
MTGKKHFVAALVVSLASTSLTAAVIVRRSGQLAPLGDALVTSLEKTPVDGPGRIVELSGDSAVDTARVGRECERANVIFTIGPEAASAVSLLSGQKAVISLGVPNPARFNANGTYVSVYPRLTAVIDYAVTTLKARRIGVLHSPAQNREIVAAFERAALKSGATIVSLPAASSGDLVRVLGGIGAGVDAIVLAIDPLLFDRQALRLIVEKSSAAKKPTIGFLPELTGFGVTVALTNEPASIAATALAAAKNNNRSATRRIAETDGLIVTVSRQAAQRIGITAESLNAQQIR